MNKYLVNSYASAKNLAGIREFLLSVYFSYFLNIYILARFDDLYFRRKNVVQVVTGPQTSCYKSVHKLSLCSHCLFLVATSFEQAVNNL